MSDVGLERAGGGEWKVGDVKMYGVGEGADRCSVRGGWGVGVLGQMREVINGENRQETM